MRKREEGRERGKGGEWKGAEEGRGRKEMEGKGLKPPQSKFSGHVAALTSHDGHRPARCPCGRVHYCANMDSPYRRANPFW